jgi:hypothetical protein
MRAMFIPLLIICSNTACDCDAGPMVQMILVFLGKRCDIFKVTPLYVWKVLILPGILTAVSGFEDDFGRATH